MDKHSPLPDSAHLLDDLESIRQLLGDADLQPPLLTETVEQIPLLLDEPAGNTSPVAEPLSVATTEDDPQTRRQDTLLHLEADLRAAAQQIMQDVINDFTPHIENEIKRRLDARMERLLKRSE
ncbi:MULTISPECIES: DNA polymerase III subunit chi [Pseudomonas]|uniref:DNA polymerase III subunit chi n=1 Tax=Pseudomonas TaxID=286 RepID=UPI0015DD26E6|nr:MULTISPECIES: DNA polymerase III subunit chi [Pseudomonas]MDM9592666.1 DNA polymerase III subunit chi [Pseudomonas guariconensis]MDM9605493.1 DNA polymerase III subunit chi [Pseudomonas guariconensis]MDM9610450.1 DNA polymerase III subunit chi [Pseudomonas guariconensis]URD43615.1 DNA polymerase III subunit chi [Pseudomonas sp. BYT-5]URK98957.1 DNA polymerase III subunit chi [Pseudomonas sp. BYT-1]